MDLNRNFDFHWLETGASFFSCSQAYAGPSAFSEPETRAVSSKILALKDRIILYTALHSYSQLILFPWGYDAKKIPEDYTELETVARKASIEIKKTHGKQYRYGSSSNVLYSSSGGADDWVKGKANSNRLVLMQNSNNLSFNAFLLSRGGWSKIRLHDRTARPGQSRISVASQRDRTNR